MLELWGALVILIFCPILGGLPVISWITNASSKRRLAEIGTGNIGVSAAFYHGGTLVGVLAVLSEALKGVLAVLVARAFFANGSYWELIALIALVIGRFLMAKGAGTTNVVWGFAVHDPMAAAFVFLVGSISFLLLRSKELAKYGVLVLFPLIVAILHFDDFAKILAAVVLAALLGWIYQQIPDDLNLKVSEAKPESQAMFQLLRGNQKILSLDDELDAAIVGNKAARCSEIKRIGYPVPKGWVLTPMDEPEMLIDYLQPSDLSPLAVRSSALGEDTEEASAAGQYESVLNVTTKEGLLQAINTVRASYEHPDAVQYRRDRLGRSEAEGNFKEAAMAVLIQQQVQGVFSGVAFSRDPITQESDAVVIEATAGSAAQVVSGRYTPEQYRAFVVKTENLSSVHLEGEGQVPAVLIKQVAYLTRQIEQYYHGIPQDIEWSYDGQTLWILQVRPITTLLPIWTRKIAAEVIPGIIHPLTWSINRPLTCGVWGGIFAIVLGERALGLDFNQTATLHFSRAYFNASLLGQIFRRMGLPAESLEFLTRGAKMSKPPLNSTLSNLPGLLRLLTREFSLSRDFKRDYRKRFVPGLTELKQQSLLELDQAQLLERIEYILELLRSATYYSIMAPLSAAIRQGIFKPKDSQIDNSAAPEVAALRELAELAYSAKLILPDFDPETLFEDLAVSTPGQKILEQFEAFINRYGYLSDVGTDIAVPTWREEPEAVKLLFVQLMQGNQPPANKRNRRGVVQRRVDLKGRVTEVYSRLLAQLRWSFIALERNWLQNSLLQQPGDIFFLEIEEVQKIIRDADDQLINYLRSLVEMRRNQLREDSQLNPAPLLVYGNAPPVSIFVSNSSLLADGMLTGIPASHGQVEGRVKVLRNLQSIPDIDKQTILVVPYTDSGWAALLTRAGGLIAEAGGRLSHGAIIAREYGIPAVMDVHNATWLLQDGQRVRVDGSRGIIEVSNDLRPG
ncbi:glycerol-3-phosphate acyltransferase [Plectonema cf. radiosum LEGE 06105]|uniref:Glycerol-3-phosphate acyltransferase n=1 Tax=Plectonema cf. radiosum LEGE 06105 TaxID=945769 RepID=A0A8J7F8G6_9CYAN|nr:glycerol-3-phosphate acyltransferase [Plectonema radiosum]MBE9216738.1 glycerol-3-phosphate acyltransferase [Plectonema cf. radiosum LEGE 06105]